MSQSWPSISQTAKADSTRFPPTNVQHRLAPLVSWTLEPSSGWRLFVASSLSIACYLCRSEMTCVRTPERLCKSRQWARFDIVCLTPVVDECVAI